jgi:hypothetical protein
MPSRPVTIFVVVLWLFMMGLVVYRDLWPQWRPGEPPAFAIDIVDETQTKKLELPWKVQLNDKPAYSALTWVEYQPGDDTFFLHARLTRLADLPPLLNARTIESAYHITRKGNLLGLQAKIGWEVLGGQANFTQELTGAVRDGRFLAARTTTHERGESRDDLPPLDVSWRGYVLLPLHPVNRLAGVRPGLKWRVPLLNPLTASTAAMIHWLDAEVSTEIVPLQRVTRLRETVEEPCRVIDYKGEDVKGRTWVRDADGTVLRQELRLHDLRWVLDGP